MVADGFPPSIAPGCDAEIDVSITIPTTPGELLKGVVVHLGCKEQPTLSLQIVAQVLATPALYATSTQLHFGTVNSADSRRRTLTVRSHNGGKVRYLRARSATPAVSARLIPLDAADSEERFEVSLDPSLIDAESIRRGMLESSIAIETEYARHHEIVISVVAAIECQDLVRLVFIEGLSPTAGKVISLRAPGKGKSARITAVNYTGDPGLTVTSAPTDSSDGNIIVRAEPADSPRVVKGELSVELAEWPFHAQIPISAFVRSGGPKPG